MENYINIEDYMQSLPENTYVRKRRVPLWGVVILVAGIAVTVLSLGLHGSEDLQMGLLSLGVIAAVAGGGYILFGALSGQFYYVPTGSRMRSYRAFVSRVDRADCIETLSSGKVDSMFKVEKENSSSCLLQAYISEDRAVALVQLKDYVPSDFVAATPVATFTGGQVVDLLHFFER